MKASCIHHQQFRSLRIINFSYKIVLLHLHDLKKVMSIFLMVLYGTVSIGIHLHAHYCGGELTDFNFFEPVKSCCDHSCNNDENSSDSQGATLNSNCCSFEEYDLSVDKNHQASYLSFDLPQALPTENPQLPKLDSVSVFSPIRFDWTNRPPPDIPLFIKYQSLVLYA